MDNDSDHDDPPIPILSMSASSRESTSDLPETPTTGQAPIADTAALPSVERFQARAVRVRTIPIDPSLEVVSSGMGDERAVCFKYYGELVSIPFCAVAMIIYAKETCGYRLDQCSFVDEYIAYILKNHPKDPYQISEADFRWMLNAQKVFKIYEFIVAEGGLMKVFPSELQPSVGAVLDDIVEIAHKWPWSRGLDEDEDEAIKAMNDSWIGWVEVENKWESE